MTTTEHDAAVERVARAISDHPVNWMDYADKARAAIAALSATAATPSDDHIRGAPEKVGNPDLSSEGLNTTNPLARDESKEVVRLRAALESAVYYITAMENLRDGIRVTDLAEAEGMYNRDLLAVFGPQATCANIALVPDEPEQVSACEGCGAPLCDGDDFVTDEEGCSGCWWAMTDAEPTKPRPCYASRVGKTSAARAALEPQGKDL
jgi:hypothetical protein